MNWKHKLTSMNRKHIFAVVFAALLITTPMAAAAQSSVGYGASRVSPTAQDAVGWFGYSLPSDTIHHSVNGNSVPGVMVTLESSEDYANLREWTNSSADRKLIQSYNGTNMALVAAPMGDVALPTVSISRILGNANTLSSLSYVEGWSLNREVGTVEPVDNLKSSDAYTTPNGGQFADLAGQGAYSPNQMAWSSDADAVDMNTTRDIVGADTVNASGEGVNVAVIDSGVSFGNGTLFGNGTAGSAFRVTDAYDFVEGEGANLSADRGNMTQELDAVEDPNGHGTWVASSILNAKSGVAPNASLMAYRALNSEGKGSTADIAAAIDRANRNGADIIVMSLGSPVYSDAMAAELRYALSEQGNVTGVFVAAGNSYTTTRYISSPADVEGVMGVTATNAANASNAKKAYFANVGPDPGLDGSGRRTQGAQPDIAAPGMKISTPVAAADDGAGTIGPKQLSGTSMAAPVAAGVGALVLDAKPGLKGSPSEFQSLLVESSAHTPHLAFTQSRGGLANASRAINGYDTPATERNLTDRAYAVDRANKFLTGGVGLKVATITETVGGVV